MSYTAMIDQARDILSTVARERARGNSSYGVTDVVEELFQKERDDMTKREFEALAKACQEIEHGLNDIVEGPWADQTTERIMELVVARIAMVCALDNPRFDSFKFNAKARQRKE